MLDLIDKHNLILLNGHPDCKGEITWQQREQKNTIDYLIMDAELHQRCEKITIDEQKEQFDFSDHNMLTSVKKTKTKINSKIEHTQKLLMLTYMKKRPLIIYYRKLI